MKLYGIKNIEQFLEKVGECQGKVELVSKEGDKLDLKSQLSKYIALAAMYRKDAEVKELELVMSEPEDRVRMMRYAMCME